MKTIVAAGMVGIMAIAAGLPDTAQAGQREWATTGKILTGVVIGGLLSGSCAPRPTCPPPVVYRQPVVWERPAPVYYRSYRPTYVAPPCQVQVVETRSYRCEPAPVRTEPIVVYLENGRRLYQPPVQGCSAYVQVWSEVDSRWVSIKEYPSLW